MGRAIAKLVAKTALRHLDFSKLETKMRKISRSLECCRYYWARESWISLLTRSPAAGRLAYASKLLVMRAFFYWPEAKKDMK